MRFGYGKRTPVGLAGLVVAAFGASALVGGSVARAQGAEEQLRLLKEGVQLMKQGRAAEANAKFRAVLAANPSDEDAYSLVKQTDNQVFLDMLVAGGDSQLVAARLLALSHKAELVRIKDEAAIKPLVDTAVHARVLDEREKAALKLASDHGEYAVPYLLPFLGSNDIDVRANAILALSRIGLDAVTPLAASLGTGSEMQQRNVASLLARIGDPRAVPALLRAARGKGPAAEEAAAAAKKLGAKDADAAGAYFHMAMAYFHGDPLTVKNYDRSYTVWSVQDGQLVGREVPRFAYNFELAEQAAYDALSLDPTLKHAQAMVALAGFAEQAAHENLSDEAKANEAIQASGKALEGAGALGASVGAAGLLDAFALAGKLRNGEAAARVADALPAVWDGRDIGPDSPLVAGLGDEDKTFRYAAAIALLRIDPARAFPMANVVPQIAGQAAAERAVRQVLVIDSDSKNAMNVQRALNNEGFHAVAYTSAPAALAAAKATAAFDAVVVGHNLTDITTFQVLDELARDFRTANVKRFVMAKGTDVEKAQTDYANRGIAAVTPTSDDSVGVVKAVKDGLAAPEGDGGRVRANQVAIAACNALAGSSHGAFNLRDAQAGLLDAIGPGGDPDVQLAALKALAKLAGPDAQGALRSVLSATDNRPENRAAAGSALAMALRGQAPAKETYLALLEAMGDANVAVRTAAGAAMGAAKLTAEQQTEVLNKRRVF